MPKVEHFLKFALVSVVLLLGAACSRNEASHSTVSFNLPKLAAKNSALGGDYVKLIVVRVSGAEAPAASFTWDGEMECRRVNCDVNPPPMAPTSVSLEVVKGQRLFQVMVAVGKDDGGMEILYGDASKQLQADTENVKIGLTSIFAGGQGRVMGRYMTGPGVGPTGTLVMNLAIPGKPMMEIMSDDIVAGWFSATFLEGVPVTYLVRETGLVLFDQKKLSDIYGAVTPTTKSAIAYTFPAFRRQNGMGCGLEDASKAVVGFFGNLAGSTYSTRDSSAPGALNGVYKVSGPGCTTGNEIDKVSYTGGGYTTAAHSISVDQSRLKNGFDSLLGMRGPFAFRSITNGGGAYEDIFEVTRAEQEATLLWTFAPGGEGALSGLDIFRSDSLNPEDFYGMNNIDCSRLGPAGFQKVSADLVPSQHTLLNVKSSTRAAVCPYLMVGGVKSYFGGHAVHALGHSPQPPLQFLDLSGNTPTLTVGSGCYAMKVRSVDFAGEPKPVSVATSVVVSSSRGEFRVWSESNCTVTQNPTLSIPAGGTEATFYAEAISAGIYSVDARADGFMNFGNYFVGASSSTSPDQYILAPLPGYAPGKLVDGECTPMHVVATDGGVVPSITSAGYNVAFDTSGFTNATINFFTDRTCSGDGSAIVLPEFQAAVNFYMKATLTSGTMASATMYGDGDTADYQLTIGTAAPAAYEISTQSPSWAENECYHASVRLLNNAGAPLRSSTGSFFPEVTATNARVYHDKDCTQGGSNKLGISILSGMANGFFYYKYQNDGVGSDIILTTNGAGGLSSGTVNIGP